MKVRFQIFGKVQGVAFRFYTKKTADQLGLKGTTKNQRDGSVVTIVEGAKKDVELFEKWCQMGSPASKVDYVKVEVLSLENEGEYEDFSILR